MYSFNQQLFLTKNDLHFTQYKKFQSDAVYLYLRTLPIKKSLTNTETHCDR